MIVNSKIKQKSKAILRVIRSLLLDSILYFVTAYMRKYPIHVTSAKGTKRDILCIYASLDEISKIFMTIHNSNYTQKCSKLLQRKMYV